jgi:hypothetical protein
MWVNNITQHQFDYIAKTMRDNGRGYVWYTGNYTAIKLTMKDWKEFFPHYLSQSVQAPQEIHEQFN